jgi:hypothetical protein
MTNPLLTVGRRRWLLQVGAGTLAGLTLPDLLHARAGQNNRRATSVIQIWLSGGPSQLDTWDHEARNAG